MESKVGISTKKYNIFTMANLTTYRYYNVLNNKIVTLGTILNQYYSSMISIVALASTTDGAQLTLYIIFSNKSQCYKTPRQCKQLK